MKARMNQPTAVLRPSSGHVQMIGIRGDAQKKKQYLNTMCRRIVVIIDFVILSTIISIDSLAHQHRRFGPSHQHQHLDHGAGSCTNPRG